MLMFCTQCRQTYLPPVSKNNNNFLVVDGFIASGNDSTIITLSRSTPISDSIFSVSESGAQVSVVGDQGEVYFLTDAGNGNYYIPSLSLNSAEKYKLRIVTSNGSAYESDPQEVRASPPIDSVSWEQSAPAPGAVNIYVTTHDPQNNTRYYKWDYVETWLYYSGLQSILEYTNDTLIYRPPADDIFTCWHTRNSTDIFINSSEKLEDDVIFKNPLAQIAAPDDRLLKKYSLLVKQYAIDRTAFNYYQQLQNNSHNLGSIFGTTPSQLKGNIHNMNDSSEVVIGYISAGSISQQRIFIDFSQLNLWPPTSTYYANCELVLLGLNEYQFYLTQGSYLPLYYKSSNGRPVGLWVGSPDCVDCRLHGGTNTKPSFWP